MFVHEKRRSPLPAQLAPGHSGAMSVSSPSRPMVLRKVCPCGGGCPRCAARAEQSSAQQNLEQEASLHPGPASQPRQSQLILGTAAGPRRLQTNLTVNDPGDEYEQEADRVDEHVHSMPD